MFEYTNGFRKALYWSKKKMEAHALKYSQGYKNDKKKGTAYTFWSKDFDGMAYKTMLRQLISKWGIMSIDMVSALDADMTVINEDGTKEYVDNDPDVIVIEQPSEPAPETPTVNQATGEVSDIQAALFGGEGQ
jgi:recombination protein RecT